MVLSSQTRFCRKGIEKKTMKKLRKRGREKERRKIKVKKKGETQEGKREKG